MEAPPAEKEPRVTPEMWAELFRSRLKLLELERHIKELSERYGLDDAPQPPKEP